MSRVIELRKHPTGKCREECGVLTRAGVRVDDGNALLAGLVLEEALLRAVVAGARQARQVEQHGHLLRHLLRGESLRRQVQVQRHLAVGRLGLVRQLQKLAAKRGDGRSRREGHCVCFWARSRWREEG